MKFVKIYDKEIGVVHINPLQVCSVEGYQHTIEVKMVTGQVYNLTYDSVEELIYKLKYASNNN